MASETGHLLFVSKTTGYELQEVEGEVPEAGTRLELDGGTAYVVAKVGAVTAPGRLPALRLPAADRVGRQRQQMCSAAARPSTIACASPLA